MVAPRGVIKIFASPFSGHYRRHVTALMSAQRGASYLDFAGITFLMLIVFIVLGRYVFTGSKEIYTDPYGVTINYGQSRSEASLVIIGKIARVYQKSQEWGARGSDWMGQSFYDITVESVERGAYPHDTITVTIGMSSSTGVPQSWPPYLKKDYKTGDRIKIYLNHDEELGYYTPALWFTIEPAS